MGTRAEFLQAFWDYGVKDMSEIELDSILSYVDSDQNGFVTFQEFVVASVFPEDILHPDILQQAFNAFDADGSGALELDELKAILQTEGKEILETEWEAIVAQVDDDGSGEISLEEFTEMMKIAFSNY